MHNHRRISSRERALEQVSKISDGTVRKTAERSLAQGTNMHLMVYAFHKVYDLPIISPFDAALDFSHISKERLAMRFALIVEEFQELCAAMDIRADINFFYEDEDGHYQPTGGKVLSGEDHDDISDKDLAEITRGRCQQAIEETDERSLPDIADACFDLKYVITGFEYEVGIDPQYCAEEGQASNMSKLMPDGSVLRREDGKVLKGPNWFPPDMGHVLKALGSSEI